MGGDNDPIVQYLRDLYYDEKYDECYYACENTLAACHEYNRLLEVFCEACGRIVAQANELCQTAQTTAPGMADPVGTAINCNIQENAKAVIDALMTTDDPAKRLKLVLVRRMEIASNMMDALRNKERTNGRSR